MKLFFAGDISPTVDSEQTLLSGDLNAAFGTIPTLVKGADRFIVNLECALTRQDTPIRKMGPNLRADPDCAKVLAELGVTDVGLSNNHVYDYGHAGFVDTLAALDKVSLPYTGVGANEKSARKPHYMKVGGRTIALIAVCEHEYTYALKDREGCWGFDPFETMEDIASAAQNSDLVIVMYHGGKEQSPYPSPRLRKACQAMVRAGADLILCQHSHCIGVMETYQDKTIVYGQGNFHFVKHSDNLHWKNGMLLQMDWDGSAKPAYTFHPVSVLEHGITLATGEEKQSLLDAFYARTEVLMDDARWMAEWNAFCESVRPTYRRGIASAFKDDEDEPAQIFPHFLDCEAHTDVWRQLYPTWNKSNQIEST